MGHPTERESAPEPSSIPTQPGLTPASAPSTTPRDAEDERPYVPPVRAYEQRVVGTVRKPAGPPKGEPTQALPTVRGAVPGAWAPPAAQTGPAAPGAPGGVPNFDRPGAAGVPPSPGAPPSPPSPGAGSLIDGLSGDGAPSRLPKVAVWAGIGVVVAGGLYAGAQWMVADKVPQGTTVAGVEIGGMTSDEAVAALEAGLGSRAAEPIAVTAGEASSTIDPTAAGLALDAEATVNGLTGFSFSPARLWEHLVGAEAVPPQLDIDRQQLDGTIAGLKDSMLVEPVDGTVKFVDGEAVATEAKDGSEIVTDQAADEIASGWLVRQGPFELPTQSVAPDIDQAETDAALAQAEQIVSGPVQVSVGGQTPELPAEAIAKAVTFEAADGALRPTFDGDALTTAIIDRTNNLLSEPNDAHFEFSGGRPVIVGGEVGTTLEPKAVAEAVGKATASDDRATEVELVEEDPENSREALEKLGVKEVVSSFSTPLTNDHIRTQNLIRGAQILTGTLVKPGETLSLYDALSPITIANGYHSSGVVSNGVHTEGVGGGLSQMATTTYNAGFFAGFDDVNHRPHSYWFTRYPAGREATIYKGALDMKFKNDTPYGAVLRAWVGGGELHVQIWGTKYYEVKESSSAKSNIVPTTTIHSTAPDCEYYPAGQPGFSITSYRKVYLDGKLVKDEAYPWTYKPDNEVVCDAKDGDGQDDG